MQVALSRGRVLNLRILVVSNSPHSLAMTRGTSNSNLELEERSYPNQPSWNFNNIIFPKISEKISKVLNDWGSEFNLLLFNKI